MSHSLDFNIREQLAGYLAGENSLHDFEDWFFSETWDIDQVADLALTNLVYGIKLRLAEFSHGDWTEDELRSLLRSFLEKHVIGNPQSQIQYGSSNVNIQVLTSLSYSALSTGRKFSVEYA